MTDRADRPTAGDRADAANRFVDAVEEAQAAIAKASKILREERTTRSSSFHYPLFLWGAKMEPHLDQAATSLRSAHEIAAIQAFDMERKSRRQLAVVSNEDDDN